MAGADLGITAEVMIIMMGQDIMAAAEGAMVEVR